MNQLAVLIRVLGRVQGVSFRVGALSVAESLQLSGWVRNLGDGSVELHAEGDLSHLQKLIEWCGQGPPSASVSNIKTDWIPPRGLNGFRIMR